MAVIRLWHNAGASCTVQLCTVVSVVVVVCQLYVARGPHKGTQTETSLFGSSCNANGTSSMQADTVLPECSCDAKMVFNDLKSQLQQQCDTDKDSALKSLEERVGYVVFVSFSLAAKHAMQYLLSWFAAISFTIATDNFVKRDYVLPDLLFSVL